MQNRHNRVFFLKIAELQHAQIIFPHWLTCMLLNKMVNILYTVFCVHHAHSLKRYFQYLFRFDIIVLVLRSSTYTILTPNQDPVKTQQHKPGLEYLAVVQSYGSLLLPCGKQCWTYSWQICNEHGCTRRCSSLDQHSAIQSIQTWPSVGGLEKIGSGLAETHRIGQSEVGICFVKQMTSSAR